MKVQIRYRRAGATIGVALGAAIGAALAAMPAQAETKLNAISFLPPTDTFAKPFLQYVEAVNSRGKGVLQIEVKPTGSVTPPNIGNAVKTGVVDMAYTIATFYKGLLPAGDAISYVKKSPDELRANGGMALWRKLHAEKVNAHYLGHWGTNVPFYFYFTKDAALPESDKGVSLAGARIRVSPLYRPLVRVLGGSGLQMPPGEIYTAIERNMVDGVGYPAWDLNAGGWGKFIKARLDVPFYNTQQGLIVNLDKWRSLTDAGRTLLQSEWDKIEAEMWAKAPGITAAQKAEQEKQGVKMLALSPAATKAFLDSAYAAGWAEVIAADPENGPKLKAMFYQ